MKIYIGSDIHGSDANVKKFLDAASADMQAGEAQLVLLGDIYNHGPRNPLPEGYAPMKVAERLNAVADRLSVVKGNCDSEVDEMISVFPFHPEWIMAWEGRTLYFTHGHKCNKDVPAKGAQDGDIVFYGHFHKADFKEVDGVRYVCVGAIGMCPDGAERSYAVVDERTVKVVSLDGGTTLVEFDI